MKCQILLSVVSKKQYFKIASAENFTRSNNSKGLMLLC